MQQTQDLIISLTEKAAKKAKQFLEKESNKEHGLRVGIVMGGCSGYMYDIGFEKSPKENDIVIEEKGVRIFMNPESIAFMKGSIIDYQDSLQNSGFKINNPNVKRKCGCGHSVG